MTIVVFCVADVTVPTTSFQDLQRVQCAYWHSDLMLRTLVCDAIAIPYSCT